MKKEEINFGEENIRNEDILEYIYEISDKYTNKEKPIEAMKKDLRTMIRYFKDVKFDKLQNIFKNQE